MSTNHPRSVRLIVLDVDGVLTDGAIVLDDCGVESKRFHVRDGLGIKAAIQGGIPVAVITARSSRAVNLRMQELGVDLFVQGARDKRVALEMVTQRTGLEPEDMGYLGDDLLDLPAMRRCGYRMAVADASPEVRQAADYVTSLPGGRGAAREAIEHVLKAQGKWDAVLETFGV